MCTDLLASNKEGNFFSSVAFLNLVPKVVEPPASVVATEARGCHLIKAGIARLCYTSYRSSNVANFLPKLPKRARRCFLLSTSEREAIKLYIHLNYANQHYNSTEAGNINSTRSSESLQKP
eukprot:c22021_g1_i1 orf=194-556(+)